MRDKPLGHRKLIYHSEEVDIARAARICCPDIVRGGAFDPPTHDDINTVERIENGVSVVYTVERIENRVSVVL